VRALPVSIGKLNKLPSFDAGTTALTSLPDSIGGMSALTQRSLSAEISLTRRSSPIDVDPGQRSSAEPSSCVSADIPPMLSGSEVSAVVPASNDGNC